MHQASGEGLENGGRFVSQSYHAETSVDQQIPDYRVRRFSLFWRHVLPHGCAIFVKRQIQRERHHAADRLSLLQLPRHPV